MQLNSSFSFTSFLRTTAATAVARHSHHNSVRLSVCPFACPSQGWIIGSVKNGAS